MLCLPFPAERGSMLAVSDASVGAIERCLLVGDRQFGINLLADAIVADPWLAVWVDRQLGRDATTAIRLAELALDELLTWLQADKAPDATGVCAGAWTRPDDYVATEFARSATRSLTQARTALRGRHDRDTLVNSATYLEALLRVSEESGSSDAVCEILGQRYRQRDDAAVWRLPHLVARLAEQPFHSAEFARILRQQKLDAMKELAYGASHEINNPLANISGRAQALLKDESDPSRRKLLHAIHTQALRAHEMISDLMLFARPPELVREPTGLNGLLKGILDELRPEVDRRQIVVEWEPPSEAVAMDVDPQQMRIAIKALLQNAIDALGANGRIELLACVESSGDEEWMELRVHDDGPGIPESAREHLFDPFYSGREAGRGLGFGLSKSWRIVTNHGGTLELEDSSSPGACFLLRLPTGPRTDQP